MMKVCANSAKSSSSIYYLDTITSAILNYSLLSSLLKYYLFLYIKPVVFTNSIISTASFFYVRWALVNDSSPIVTHSVSSLLASPWLTAFPDSSDVLERNDQSGILPCSIT